MGPFLNRRAFVSRSLQAGTLVGSAQLDFLKLLPALSAVPVQADEYEAKAGEIARKLERLLRSSMTSEARPFGPSALVDCSFQSLVQTP